MSAFSRAYRDPKSPLTPLKPFATNTAFSFNLGGDDSLKPFIEAQRTKGTSRSSPAGRAGGINVNPSKYTNQQPTCLNTKNVKSDGTPRSSPAGLAGGINVNPCKYTNQQPTYLNTKNVKSENAIRTRKLSARSTSSKNSGMISNSEPDNYTNWGMSNSKPPKYESTFDSSCGGGHRLDDNDSKATNSDLSSSSSSCSSSTSHHENICRHRPPKLVFDDTPGDEVDSRMSSVFNWVWNRLSPMANPSIYELLARVGMQEYWTIFEREEILDLDVFSTLTMDDLKVIGIQNPNDCVKILKSVGMALNFLSGLFALKKP
ncbi:uncharacterized protein LOC128859091 [Anastrepha ludens]|uniref:uncharacterized protein LOC128859091 n=1 Tax=Anastrepha ludens TaxID=28586 RepID=UPI0023B01B5C|nr:uncharacterized protein LOC128859091 [Anastrepha ludens]